MIAAAVGNAEVVHQLLRLDANVNTVDTSTRVRIDKAQLC